MKLEEVYKDLDILDKSEHKSSFAKDITGLIDSKEEMEKIYHIPEDNIIQLSNGERAIVGFVDSRIFDISKNLRKELKIKEDYIQIYITDDSSVYSKIDGASKILVKDLTEAKLLIANMFYGETISSLNFIGSIGSTGTEETTMMLKGVLDKAEYKTGLIGSIYGVIDQKIIYKGLKELTILKVIKMLSTMKREGVTHVILEMHDSFLDVFEKLNIKFKYMIYTNFSMEHETEKLDSSLSSSDKKETLKKLREKRNKFIASAERTIVNIDDFVASEIKKLAGKGNFSTYGLANKADYNAVDINIKNTGSTLITFLDKKAHRMNSQIILPEAGYLILAVVAVTFEMGITPTVISEGMNNIVVKGKMELVQNQPEIPIIIDAGKNLKELNSTLKLLRTYVSGRLLTIFGYDGDYTEEEKVEAARILGKFSDFVTITTGMSKKVNPNKLAKELLSKLAEKDVTSRILLDRKVAIEQAISHADRKDMVVIIGLGMENFLELRDKKVPFNERKIIREHTAKIFVALENGADEEKTKQAEELMKKLKMNLEAEDE